MTSHLSHSCRRNSCAVSVGSCCAVCAAAAMHTERGSNPSLRATTDQSTDPTTLQRLNRAVGKAVANHAEILGSIRSTNVKKEPEIFASVPDASV